MEEKFKCNKCLKEKDLSEFPIHKSNGKNRRRCNCRDCYNEYYKAYLNNQKHKNLVKKRYYKNSAIISDLKLKNGCLMCGYNKCSRALDFHHIDKTTKKHNISGIVKCKQDTVINEIAKCVVLCANCHREFEAGLITLPSEI